MSGCIISFAEICGLNQDKKYGGWDARGYAAASNAPNGITGTLKAWAGSTCCTKGIRGYLIIIYMYVYILEKLLYMKQVKLPLTRGKSSLSDDLEVV